MRGAGPLDGVRGLLLDVDGTLLAGEEAIPGAAEALGRIRARGLRLRLTTNTSRRPRSAIAGALARAGLAVTRDEILVPASLARRRILDSGRFRAALLVPGPAREDFEGVAAVEEAPDWVVLGDLGDGFTFEALNRAFRWLRAGAPLLALHRNRFWHDGARGPVLDVGAFAAALEYASGVRAETLGKPARPFFDLALREIGLPAREVAVVGDDAEADASGGAAAGCRTVLVRTGKGSEGEGAGGRADLVLDSIAGLLRD